MSLLIIGIVFLLLLSVGGIVALALLSGSTEVAATTAEVVEMTTEVAETAETTAGVNCEVSEWGQWADCGMDGQQSRSRTVTVQPYDSGEVCPYLSEQQSCTPANEIKLVLRGDTGTENVVLFANGVKFHGGVLSKEDATILYVSPDSVEKITIHFTNDTNARNVRLSELTVGGNSIKENLDMASGKPVSLDRGRKATALSGALLWDGQYHYKTTV
jgi:hypothetical protein